MLEACVGRERPARQPCPLDRALAFLDPLFARPALIVEGDDPVGRARQVGDDETDARIKLAGMPFDFADHPARLGPASRLIGEIGMEPTHLVRWSSDWALEQVADLSISSTVFFILNFGIWDLQRGVPRWAAAGGRRQRRSRAVRREPFYRIPP